ncbi:aspartate 1-decarboxylase [Bradyrhizobium sp. BWC-3-1]
MLITVMRGKIHQVSVTETDLHYDGPISMVQPRASRCQAIRSRLRLV